MQIAITDITVDPWCQGRTGTDMVTVAEYADAMKAGDAFPPVVVFGKGPFWLSDGFHRIEASKIAGAESVTADVRPGGRREAKLHSCGANASHGRRRTNADKRRVVVELLMDEEWGKRSTRWIAERCRVSHMTVQRLKAEADCNTVTVEGRDGRTTDTTNIGNNRERIIEVARSGIETATERVENISPETLIDMAARMAPKLVEEKAREVRRERVKPRDELDRYYTPGWCVDVLVDQHLDRYLGDEDRVVRVWEPSSGSGDIARPLGDLGAVVFESDIDPALVEVRTGDFLDRSWQDTLFREIGWTVGKEWAAPDWIITNPPFVHASDFVRTALRVTPRVAMFMRLTWAEPCQERWDILHERPPQLVIVVPRPTFGDRTGTDSVTCAWYVWDPALVPNYVGVKYGANDLEEGRHLWPGSEVRWVGPEVRR